MLSIVYVSSASRLLTDRELVDLLTTNQRNNAALGITGLLLYKGGNFMQVIEGPDEAVLRLYEKIQRDPRHRDVYLLRQIFIQDREFPNWSMGFQNVDQLPVEAASGFSAFLTDVFKAEVYRQDPGRAHKLLLMFRENMMGTL